MRRILLEPVESTPKQCRNFNLCAKTQRSDLPVLNIEQDVAKQLDRTLKPSNLKEITYLTHFYPRKSKGPRLF